MKVARRRELVHAAWRHWRAFGFPHYQLSSLEISLEFKRLTAQDLQTAFSRAGALGSVVGLRIANFFQPGMWSVRVSRYRSPMDVFQDDSLLQAAIERAWTIWPDRCGANSSTLRRMLKTFPSTASVSNFRPTLARAVIERYSAPGSTVVDFSAGYGGRLTGCLTLDRNYIGIEPNEEQVAGLRSTIGALVPLMDGNPTAEIIEGCAEDVLPHMPPRLAGLVFSSPPYYNWERYSDSPKQSFIRYGSYDGWLKGFLEPCIWESRRILRRSGRLVLNISGRSRWPSAEDVIRIAERSNFRLIEVMPMLLARVPYLHPRGGGPYKPELLLVFEQGARG
ncbi:MAG TPA: hypothetical protein VK604_27160 [Bryobacteraceae bacterium]|nr:hypothetical protein [Bryobacteraceae bacterium]